MGVAVDARQLLGKCDSERSHPLVCHLIDVAHVCAAILEQANAAALLARLSEAVRLDQATCRRWLAFWVGAHDAGKASPSFQARLGATRQLQRAGWEFLQPVPEAWHGTTTACVLPDLLCQSRHWPAIDPAFAVRIGTTVGGHHGTFPRSEAVQMISCAVTGSGQWEQARGRMLATLADALELGPDSPRPEAPRVTDHAFFMVLAGLTSVADWIGSNEHFFPFAGVTVELRRYVRRSRRQAERALQTLGWGRWQAPRVELSFRDQFGFEPRPLQHAVLSLLPTVTRPSLLLVEAPMGEGKTEAAFTFADHNLVQLDQRGIYFALPTQATSNAMFSRTVSFLEQRFRDQRTEIEMHLLHGTSRLSRDYHRLRPSGVGIDEPEAGGTVVAHEWFMDCKRGLLSPFAVGTIDQALLAVLQTRHVFVRLFGLAGKTIILDEVHAYDTYMSTLLDRLLEWLAALGCSVVLLSATLPRLRRDQLVKTFSGGHEPPNAAYPQITLASAGKVHVQHVSSARRFRLNLRSVRNDPEAIADLLNDKLGSGGCAAIICNTVKRAQQVYQVLKQHFLEPDAGDGFPELDLLHARFPFAMREERENRCIRRFGKDGHGGARPGRAVLVATQIIEQSLDLDFDVMVTDLAPVDLVLQRAGRLHRHQEVAGRAVTRPKGLEQPTLWLATPEIPDGQVPDFGDDEYVYDRHVLLRTYLELIVQGRAYIRVPEDLQRLIDTVYDGLPGSGPTAAWSVALEQSFQKREQESHKANELARRVLVRKPDYEDDILEAFNAQLEEDDPEVHRSLRALTRLTSPSVSLICVHTRADRDYLDHEHREGVDPEQPPADRHDLGRWLERLIRASVTITHRAAVNHFRRKPVPKGWHEVGLLRYHRLVRFVDGNYRLDQYTLHYAPELGIRVLHHDDS